MGVEVVEDQDDPLCLRVMDVHQFFHHVHPVDLGASPAAADDFHVAPARKRLNQHEKVGHPIVSVFMIKPLRLATASSPWGACIGFKENLCMKTFGCGHLPFRNKTLQIGAFFCAQRDNVSLLRHEHAPLPGI